MSKSCQGLLKELVKCLRESDCFKVSPAHQHAILIFSLPMTQNLLINSHKVFGTLQKEGKDIKTCAKDAAECKGVRNAYAACKRGQLDPRARIRGNIGY